MVNYEDSIVCILQSRVHVKDTSNCSYNLQLSAQNVSITYAEFFGINWNYFMTRDIFIFA